MFNGSDDFLFHEAEELETKVAVLEDKIKCIRSGCLVQLSRQDIPKMRTARQSDDLFYAMLDEIMGNVPEYVSLNSELIRLKARLTAVHAVLYGGRLPVDVEEESVAGDDDEW